MKQYFLKIRLLCYLADSIADYGVQCGHANLMEQVDMTCGAIPEGSYEQIVDPGAPEQFLSMYARIAASRFVYAVMQVMGISSQCLGPIREFLHRTGCANRLDEHVTPEKALAFLDLLLLEGLPGTDSRQILSQTEDEIVWRTGTTVMDEAIERFGGDAALFCTLQEAFVDGLLSESGTCFQKAADGSCAIKHIS